MKIYWLDIETTSLIPRDGHILEIAVAVADLEDPFNATFICDMVVHLPRFFVAGLSPFIRDMHTKNGLLEACVGSEFSLADVDGRLLDSIQPTEGVPHEDWPILAGSSVHFDHGFLHEHMPVLAKRFSHRHYDVSAVNLFCQSLGMEKPAKAEAHRAREDVLESIVHGKMCAEWLRTQKERT